MVLKWIMACNIIKKETLAQVFSREFCEISKNIFSYRTPLLAAFIVRNIFIRKWASKTLNP